MGSDDVLKTAKKRFKALLARRSRLRRRVQAVEMDLFKHETAYLEMAQGSPLTRTVEYYVSNRAEKKKHGIDDRARIFGRDFPRPSK